MSAGRTLTTPAELAAAGLVSQDNVAELAPVAARYAVAVTPVLAAKIAEAPEGPLARQFLPDARELLLAPEERADPIGDHAFSPVEGIVHRYPDRVLLKLVHVCPVYCRYCFRREMVGPAGDGALSGAALDAALAYIAATPAIREVILTGGDPMMLSARRIGDITARLGAIGHLDILRWHSRVPVAAPERVTAEVVAGLRAADTAVWVVVHANHADELGPEAAAALGRLVDAGIPVLSQSVLLRGVNDDPRVLEALFRRLVALRVKPYALHHPDLAPGTGHFRLSIAEGQRIVAALRGHVSGLCQPTYLVDIPGGHGKAPVGPCAYHEADGTVTDRNGVAHKVS